MGTYSHIKGWVGGNNNKDKQRSQCCPQQQIES